MSSSNTRINTGIAKKVPYPEKDFMRAQNIKNIYQATRDHFVKVMGIDIEDRYVEDLRDVMKYIYDHNNRKLATISDNQFRNQLNKKVLDEIIPYIQTDIKQNIVNPPGSTPLPLTGMNTIPPNVGMNGLVPDESLNAQQINAQFNQLKNLYVPINNDPPAAPNFVDNPNDPRFNVPKMKENTQALLNDLLSQRKGDVLPPPDHQIREQYGALGQSVAFQPEVVPLVGIETHPPREIEHKSQDVQLPTQTEHVSSVGSLEEQYSTSITGIDVIQKGEMGRPNLQREGATMTNMYTIPPFDQKFIPEWSRYQIYPSHRIPEMLSVDSRQRSDAYPSPSQYKYFLNKGVYKNVVSVKLMEACIPKTDYVVNTSNNTIYFEETDGITQSTTIPVGNYADINAIMTAVVAAMNAIGGSTYTFTVDTLTGKVTVTSNGAGGGGVFNFLFANGTMDTGAGLMTMYKSNSIGQILGYPPTNLTGALSYSAPWVPDLTGDCFVLLFIEEFQKLDSSSSTMENAFAKIPMDTQFGENQEFSDGREFENIKYFSPPIGKLGQLNISFRRYDGSLYDFNGRNHSFLLEIVCVDDEHRNI